MQTYAEPPLLQTYSDVSDGYESWRKQPVVNRLGFNWNRVGSSLPTYNLDYDMPVDERLPVEQEATPGDRIVYGRDERSRSASSIASEDFGRESRNAVSLVLITSGGAVLLCAFSERWSLVGTRQHGTRRSYGRPIRKHEEAAQRLRS